MTTQNPHSGNDTAFPKAKTHRLTFDVTGDFLSHSQDVLFNTPRRIAQLADFLDLMGDLTKSEDFASDDPRLKAAFAVASDAMRMMALREGQMCEELFSLMDDDRNISKAV